MKALDSKNAPWALPLLQALPDGVAYMVSDHLVWVNDAFAKIVGLPREKLIGISAYQLMPVEEHARVSNRRDARLRGENPTDAYEVSYKRSDGSVSRVRMEPRVLGPKEMLILIRELGPYEREHQLLTDLSKIAIRLQHARDMDSVLDAAADGLAELGLSVSILRVHEGLGQLKAMKSSNPEVAEMFRPYVEHPVPLIQLVGAETVLTTEQAVYIDDAPTLLRARATAEGIPFSEEVMARFAQLKLDKLVVASIFVQGSPWGILYVSASVLSSKDAAALSLFASQIGSALEVSRRIEELERQNRWWSAIHRAAQDANDLTEDSLLPTLLPLLQEATESDSVCVYRVVPGTGGRPQALELTYHQNEPAWFAEKYARVPIPGTPGTIALPAASVSLTPQDWPEPFRSDLIKIGFHHTAVIPLIVGGKMKGSFNLARFTARPFTEGELRSASILGSQLSAQLERGRLVSDLRHSYDVLAKTQQVLVTKERLAALGELAAVIAHEVRNPLGVIFNSLHSLRRIAHGEESSQLLDYLAEESERLNRLVGELLDFARPHEPELLPASVQDLVCGAVESVSRMAIIPTIQVREQVDDNLPPVHADAQMIRQALVNLLLNGAQAMPQGGELLVSAQLDFRAERPAVRIDVTDFGQGIRPELLDQIFHPFFTTKASGTGLGLALVKRIVEAHRAEIAVKSTLGKGTTFSIWLRVGNGMV